jgi:four helix bundle protein
MANRLDELPIFHSATAFCDAITALLEGTEFGRNHKLRDQIREASDSITANMREGFEQGTDAAFGRYLYIAKGSLGEVLARLARARRRRCISAEELAAHTATGEELGRMLGGFIKYLARSNFKDRGRRRAALAQSED